MLHSPNQILLVIAHIDYQKHIHQFWHNNNKKVGYGVIPVVAPTIGLIVTYFVTYHKCPVAFNFNSLLDTVTS